MQRAFSFYVTQYNQTGWRLPFHAHETYDAVAESARYMGEGNNGYVRTRRARVVGGSSADGPPSLSPFSNYA